MNPPPHPTFSKSSIKPYHPIIMSNNMEEREREERERESGLGEDIDIYHLCHYTVSYTH